MLRYQYLPRWYFMYFTVHVPGRYHIRIRIIISMLIKTMRIQPQVLHMRENFFTINFTSFSVCNVLSFSSVSKVSCFSVFWTAYWHFLEHSTGTYSYLLCICFELIPIRNRRIRISMPWMPIPIQIRIPQNDMDPTPSGSITLIFASVFITTFGPDPKHCFTVPVP